MQLIKTLRLKFANHLLCRSVVFHLKGSIYTAAFLVNDGKIRPTSNTVNCAEPKRIIQRSLFVRNWDTFQNRTILSIFSTMVDTQTTWSAFVSFEAIHRPLKTPCLRDLAPSCKTQTWSNCRIFLGQDRLSSWWTRHIHRFAWICEARLYLQK